MRIAKDKPSAFHRRMAHAQREKARGAAGLMGRPSEAKVRDHWEREMIKAREAVVFHDETAERLESEGR